MSDLRTAHVETRSDGFGKIVGAIGIALIVLAGGAYTYREGWWDQKKIPFIKLPAPSLPVIRGSPQRS